MTRQAPADLHALFNSGSVAILGASSDPTKLGGRPIRFLRASGYRGPIYPVNPKAAEIQGYRAYAAIAELPDAVDHAIVALPAQAVPAALEQCAARGVKSATVFSSGFAEIGDAGVRAQARIGDIARAAGMRILGPNCMGFMNLRTGLIASFAFMVDLGLPPLGRIALVSQSGAFGGQALVMAKEKGVPLGAWVTTGNECDVELADCIAYFAQDEHTDVIMGYMEGCRSPDKLIDALALAQQRGKPVIMVKAGGSQIGREAVQSHTGALAGNDRVFDAVFRQYGVHRAHSVEAFFDVAYAASGGRYPRSGKVGVFTVSGGIGVLMADAAEKRGLQMPALPAAARDEIKALLPHASVRNPVDGTAQIWSDMSVFETVLRTMIRAGDFDSVVLFLTAMPHAPHLQAPLQAVLKKIRAEFPDHVLIASMLAPPALAREVADAGYLLFEDATRAIDAIAALRDLSAVRATTVVERRVHATDASARIVADGPQNEHQLKSALRAAGLPVPEEIAVDTLAAAKAAAARLRYPIALKILSPDILHKSDIGGIALDVSDEAALEREWTAIMTNVQAHATHARIDGMLVAPMCARGVELIVGVRRDPIFGPVVMAGLGGVFVEVFEDVALRLAPVDMTSARAMLQELKGFALLDGARGRPRCDIDAVCRVIVRLSEIGAASADVWESIEINPLTALPAGHGAFVLDAAAVPLPRSATR